MTSKIFDSLKLRAHKNRFENASVRIKKLKTLQSWIKNHESDIEAALYADFKKPAFEAQVTEILFTLSEVKFFIQNLSCWMKDKRVNTPLSLFGHKSYVHYENKGVVLLVSPWNYPFMLTVAPLIAAVAAGNTVVIKPSELTPHVSQLLEKMIKDCFDADDVTLEQGDKEKTTELLGYHFDHVFFTGSTNVGKIVAKSCAERLIPYTLELGGKSPAIIDANANIEEAVRKIQWGKFANRGQACVAPDTLFVHKKIKSAFLAAYKKYDESLKSETPSDIISARHSERLKNLTNNQVDLKSSNTALIDLDDVTQFPKIQEEEIFGPIATVSEFESIEDIRPFYEKNKNPLALYVFSKNTDFIDQVIRNFPSGGVGINTLVVHLANHNLPFGGVGNSGQGRYHGHFGFLEFSHQRAVLKQWGFNFLLEILFPPYTTRKKQAIDWMKKFLT